MATSKQLTANRRNALKSTGPKTPAGKLTVSQNALRHGILARGALLPGENPAQLEALRKSLINHYRPATPAEHIVLERLIHTAWRMRRLDNLEGRIVHAHQEASRENRQWNHNIFLILFGKFLNAGEKNGPAVHRPSEAAAERAPSTWSDPVARAYMRDSQHGNTILKLTHCQTAVERSFLRCLHELERLIALRTSDKSAPRAPLSSAKSNT